MLPIFLVHQFSGICQVVRMQIWLSDGGSLLLKAADQSLGLIQALIACGYEDCNDAARLSHDPVHRLMMGRDPLNGKALASQPTLSRFENAIEGRSLVRMGHALADRVIKRHRKRLGKRVRRVTIDMDPTDHATYGGQQLSFFSCLLFTI